MTPALSFSMIAGLRTASLSDGQGQPVLLLHGWGASLELTRPLAERLVALGYHTVALDLPGFGQTAPPPAPWSVIDYAQFVCQFLDDRELPRVHLFGHSFGGRIGLVLGAEHADRLLKMTLADSAGVRPVVPPLARIRLRTYRMALNVLRAARLSSSAEALRAWYGRRYGSQDYQAAKGVMRETFIRVVNEDLLPYAARVRVPTLLFWGEQDHDTPLVQGRLLERTIPDAGLIIWERAGHYSYLERLTDTARVMDHFFRQDN